MEMAIRRGWVHKSTLGHSWVPHLSRPTSQWETMVDVGGSTLSSLSSDERRMRRAKNWVGVFWSGSSLIGTFTWQYYLTILHLVCQTHPFLSLKKELIRHRSCLSSSYPNVQMALWLKDDSAKGIHHWSVVCVPWVVLLSFSLFRRSRDYVSSSEILLEMAILIPRSSPATNQHHPHRRSRCFRHCHYPCDIALHGIPTLDRDDGCSGLYHVCDNFTIDLGCSV